jgi:hypothetical protein
MKIYNYNSENGYFVGESLADESPLEPGIFLIPAHATTIEPPTTTNNELAVFDGQLWTKQEVISNELSVEEIMQKQAEAEAKATAKAALLTQLGITEEQARLLLS